MTRFANTSLHSVSTLSEPHPLLGTGELSAFSNELELTDMLFLMGLLWTMTLVFKEVIPESVHVLGFRGEQLRLKQCPLL